jgi:hypothetical protein
VSPLRASHAWGTGLSIYWPLKLGYSCSIHYSCACSGTGGCTNSVLRKVMGLPIRLQTTQVSEANGEDRKVRASDSVRRPYGARTVASARSSVRAFSVRRRVHFRRAERHDRFGGGQKPPRKVTGVARRRCYSRGRRRPARGPRETVLNAVGGVGRRLARPFDLRGRSCDACAKTKKPPCSC